MRLVWGAVCIALGATALAQPSPPKPPVAVYWMDVETASGMGIPGAAAPGAFVAGVLGGQGAGRRMMLQLASQRTADTPRAEHLIPPGMQMGRALPLLGPERAPQAARREPGESALPEGVEPPRGRMLIYWGCGEQVRAGQPVIVDFARLAQGQPPPGMVSRRVSVPAPPSPGRARTYGEWPNREDAKPVPASASLVGEHEVKANYAPAIRFALEAVHDFMDRVELAVNARASGAASLAWNAVRTATGYFATAIGAEGDDAVVWSSSEVQEMGGMLMDFVPPGEVARLIREKVVLPASVTECTVPAEVVKRSVGTAWFRFIAYGPEANFAHPPRPQDPRQPWEPLWSVKVRFKSTASTVLGGAADEERRPGRAAPPREERAAEPQRKPAAPDPLKEGIEILRGIFGR